MAVLISRQPQSTCVAPNSDARFALGCEGDIASFDWQYSTDLETWYNIGWNSNTLVLNNVQTENTRSYYRCKIEDSTDGTYVYSATVELFVFDEDFVRKVIRGGDMFLAMVDVYTSLRHQTNTDMSNVINEIQAALNQKSSVDHVHDSRYYRQDQTDDMYLTDVSISDKTMTFTYGDGDTKTISTQDYRVQNTPSATTKAYLVGTPTATETVATQVFDTSIYLDTTAGHLVAPYFDGNALNDTLGQRIDDTYIKNLSIVDKTITFIKGDGDTGTITTQDYRVQSVPNDTTKAYLVADANATDHTGTLIKDTSIYLDTTAGHLVAPYFDGNALNDTLGQQIDETYIKNISINDKTITFTRGDDTTDTITTQDYRVQNTPSATTKAYITGTPTATESVATQVFDTSVYLDTTAGHLVAPYFDGNALNDTLGQKIDETYIKGLSINDKTITFTRGDATTGTITTQDYRVQNVPNDSTKAYLVATPTATQSVGTQIFDTSIYLDTEAGHLVAPYFDGNALNDTLGQKIDETYIKGLSISDKTITYTRGDNTTGTIGTQDYRVQSVPNATTKAYLVATTTNTDTTGTLIKDTGVYLDTTAGPLTATEFKGNLTGNALNDTLGQQIDDTYIKELSISDKTITYTKGDGDTGTITTPDYRVQSTPSSTTKAYLVGTTANAESTGTLIKDTSVYLDTTAGHLVAPYFDGNALNDTLGQKIDETYVKDIDITYSEGNTTLTFTKGDDTDETVDLHTKYTAGTGLTLTDNREFSHPTSGVTAGTYKSVTVNALGHVTAGSNPTTIAGYGITDAYTKTQVDTKISDLVNSAPETLDTLNELATALGNDPNFATTMATELGKKVDKTAGITGLSISDKTITYTRGDNTTGTITTQDYRVKTTPTADTATSNVYLSGTTSSTETTGTQNINTKIYYKGTTLYAGKFVGAIEGNVTGTSEKATSDASGNNIESTYETKANAITGLSINDKTITYTKGNSTTGTITTPDYRVQNNVANTTKAYLVGSASNENATGVLVKDTGVYLDTTAGHLTATQFNGALNGKAATAGKLHSAVNITVGNKTNSFDGGTAITFSLADIGAQAAGNYAGSSSAGGAATSANKLNTDAGSGTQPVYFSSGVPVATTYALNKTVPNNALFTDQNVTNTALADDATTKVYLTGTSTSTTNTGGQSMNAKIYFSGTTLTAPTFSGALSGNASTATKLNAGVNITVGNKTNSFDGSTAISFSLADIGAAASGHTHNYAGSSSAGGAATSANKLNTDAGSATQPVYFSSGVPVATTYALNKTVPSDAVFTDTNNAVTNTVLADNAAKTVYLTGTQSSTTATGGQNFNTKIYFNNTTLTAPTFSGALSGKATSAGKLQNGSTDYAIGSATQPIYFSGGVPVATTYSLSKSVPSNAVFTDTTYSAFTGATSSAAGSSGLVPAPTAGNQGKFLRADGTWANATYDVFTAASASAAGTQGLVPAPAAGDQVKFLRADKTWTAVTPSLIGASASGHTHNYAGSSSAGGAATSANKLNTDAGSGIQPVYFSSGVPVATTYALNKTVPSNAVFTDTNNAVTNTLNTTTKAYVTGTTSATTTTGGQIFDTGVYLDTTAGHLTATQFNGALNGKATSAGKLQNGSTDYAAGSGTQPVYFSGGVPVATTYTLGKSVPSDAVFTDHTYSAFTGASSSSAGGTGLVPAPTSAQYNYFLRGDGTWQPVAADTTSPHRTSGKVGTGYYHRNIAYGTSSTPTSDATYGGSGAMYAYYT